MFTKCADFFFEKNKCLHALKQITWKFQLFQVFYCIVFDTWIRLKTDLNVLVVLGLQQIWKGGTEFPNAPFPYRGTAIPSTNTTLEQTPSRPTTAGGITFSSPCCASCSLAQRSNDISRHSCLRSLCCPTDLLYGAGLSSFPPLIPGSHQPCFTFSIVFSFSEVCGKGTARSF